MMKFEPDPKQSPKQYGLPKTAITVLETARREKDEAERAVKLAFAEFRRCESRYMTFVSALAATVGVPDGTTVTVDVLGNRLVVENSAAVSSQSDKGS